MKTTLMLIASIISLIAQNITIQPKTWELLGTSAPLSLSNATQGGCIIYAWENNQWSLYSTTKENKALIQANKGFFISSINTSCTIKLNNIAENMTDKQNTQESRFYSMQENNQTRLIDSKIKLEWINSSPGCLPLDAGLEMEDVRETMKNHCDNVIFSNKSDWRAPTTEEVREFIMGTSAQNLIPYYKNKGCPRLIGINNDKNTLSTVNTHNNNPIGKINPWEKLNGGVRCVRENSK